MSNLLFEIITETLNLFGPAEGYFEPKHKKMVESPITLNHFFYGRGPLDPVEILFRLSDGFIQNCSNVQCGNVS